MKPRNLYDVAKQVCHEFGMPWVDPRTGIKYLPEARKTKRIRQMKKGTK